MQSTTLTQAAAVEAWHFLPADRRTRYSGELVTKSSVLHVPGEIEICERGLHASRRAIDALQYAPGPIVCRVRVWGDVQEQSDKIVGSYRECISMCDATNTLHEFTCCVAETALLIADVKDKRCWQAIEAKRAWLRGEIDNRQLAAARAYARDAAMAAARDAARAAARDAARDAAWDAARDAAWDAAWAAAWDAARAYARDAAWAYAWDEQNKTLESMLRSVCK